MKIIFFLILLLACDMGLVAKAFAQEERSPIVVNGEQVEYSSNSTEVTVTGNVVITYKESRLTADKVKVNTTTKDAVAEGNVFLEDARGIIEAESLMYNFDTMQGMMLKAKVKAGEQYGSGEVVERLSDQEFRIKNGYLTTCNLDKPHYKIFSKDITLYAGDKIKSKNDVLYVGGVPILYLPQYTHSLKDPLMHMQLRPGQSKDWGGYLLSTWRYDITESLKSKIYLDYRQKRGMASGFGLNYNSSDLGKGDFKFYYTHEQPDDLPQDSPQEFERYLVRWRHAWKIDPMTSAMWEYHKIEDSKRQIDEENTILKDYFYKEYEKDLEPKSYFLLNRSLSTAFLSLYVQKRVNSWYTQAEKLPELSFDLPKTRMGDTPLYFMNETRLSNLRYLTEAPSDRHHEVARFDTYNQLSIPAKLAFFWVTPYAGIRETYYTKDAQDNSIGPRTVFDTGAEISTKFYRVFDVQSNFLGLDINGLRHIITPAIEYSYVHDPTVPDYKFKPDFFTTEENREFFDSIDNIRGSNTIYLELSNKLQTKRNGKTVDLVDFLARTSYILKPEGSSSTFSDILFDLELTPYSWLSFESDVTYGYQESKFKIANADLNFEFSDDKNFGVGYRYERKGEKQLTSELEWRVNPKWKLGIYERYQFAATCEHGLLEQEYTLTRDLHCWTVEFAYNISKHHGHTVWLMFTLKAFPEVELGMDAHYNSPKDKSSE